MNWMNINYLIHDKKDSAEKKKSRGRGVFLFFFIFFITGFWGT